MYWDFTVAGWAFGSARAYAVILTLSHIIIHRFRFFHSLFFIIIIIPFYFSIIILVLVTNAYIEWRKNKIEIKYMYDESQRMTTTATLAVEGHQYCKRDRAIWIQVKWINWNSYITDSVASYAQSERAFSELPFSNIDDKRKPKRKTKHQTRTIHIQCKNPMVTWFPWAHSDWKRTANDVASYEILTNQQRRQRWRWAPNKDEIYNKHII